MSIVQEYLEQRKNYDPTPPKPNKTYNKFFGGVVIKSINFYTSYPLFGIKLKNGDYEVSPYWKQREWEYWFEEQELIKFRKEYKGSYQYKGWEERGVTKLFWERRKRLLKDAERDEPKQMGITCKRS
jgi:hypothetical protein